MSQTSSLHPNPPGTLYMPSPGFYTNEHRFQKSATVGTHAPANELMVSILKLQLYHAPAFPRRNSSFLKYRTGCFSTFRISDSQCLQQKIWTHSDLPNYTYRAPRNVSRPLCGCHPQCNSAFLC